MSDNERELIKQKELADKRLLNAEVVLCAISFVYFIAIIAIASLLPMADWLRIVLIFGSMVPFVFGMLFALKIEQVAGYYECKECKHRYIPTYMAVNLAPHIGRTRYMKCPQCGKRSWQKKRIAKD